MILQDFFAVAVTELLFLSGSWFSHCFVQFSTRVNFYMEFGTNSKLHLRIPLAEHQATHADTQGGE